MSDRILGDSYWIRFALNVTVSRGNGVFFKEYTRCLSSDTATLDFFFTKLNSPEVRHFVSTSDIR